MAPKVPIAKFHGETIRLPDKDADGVSISDAMITVDSKSRAINLRAQQFMSAPPEERMHYARTMIEAMNKADPKHTIKDYRISPDYPFPDLSNENISDKQIKALLDANEKFFQDYRPENYVVRYYMSDDSTPAISPRTDQFKNHLEDTVTVNQIITKVPYVREGNQPDKLNANMLHAVNDAFATIQSQLPGRFTFIRVDDPKDADISFASLPKSEKMSGVTSSDGTAILFNQTAFSKGYTDRGQYLNMPSIALHEINHALGLEHPHNSDKREGTLSTEKASYFQTVQTYTNNNNYVADGAASGQPITLMPSDIAAYLKLYPIKADKNGAEIGIPEGLIPSSGMRAITVIGKKGSQSQIMASPNMGDVHFQPVPDTSEDVVVVGETKKPLSYPVIINQLPNGRLVIREYESEAVLSIHAERIELSTGSDMLATNGKVSIYSPTNQKGSVDSFDIWKKDNHLNIAAADLQQSNLRVISGAQLDLTIRDMKSQGLHSLENLVLDYGLTEASSTPTEGHWHKNKDGSYDIHMAAAKAAAKGIDIHVTLEDADTQSRKKFEELLDGGMLLLPSQPPPMSDSGLVKLPMKHDPVPSKPKGRSR